MEPYNVGYGAEITIGDIVNTIQKVSGLTPKIVWDNSKPTTIPFRMVSTEKINNLGFISQVIPLKKVLEKQLIGLKKKNECINNRNNRNGWFSFGRLPY